MGHIYRAFAKVWKQLILSVCSKWMKDLLSY